MITDIINGIVTFIVTIITEHLLTILQNYGLHFNYKLYNKDNESPPRVPQGEHSGFVTSRAYTIQPLIIFFTKKSLNGSDANIQY